MAVNFERTGVDDFPKVAFSVGIVLQLVHADLGQLVMEALHTVHRHDHECTSLSNRNYQDEYRLKYREVLKKMIESECNCV